MVSQPTQSQLDRILAELADLRDSLAILTRRVDRLSTLVEERGIGTETSGVGSASVVSSAAASGYVGQHPTQSVVAEEAGFAVGWAEREAVARGIGLWLRRSVSGEHRGNSGGIASVNLHGSTLCAGTSLVWITWILLGSAIGLRR